jgi:integrase
MSRELKGTVFRQKTKSPDGRPTWAFRLHREKGGQQGGFRTQGEAKEALQKERDHYLGRRANQTGIPHDIQIAELAELYLSQLTVEPTTAQTYRDWLRAATRPRAEGGFGDLPARNLTPFAIAKWRSTLPARSAFHYTKGLRQLLAWAKDVAHVIPENAAAAAKNPKPKRSEVAFFSTWAEVEQVDDELPAWAAGFAVVGAGLGTRPEELLAARRLDLDLAAGALTIRRTYSKGLLREYGKTPGSFRRIPLRPLVIDCLRDTGRIGVGLDPAGLLFPPRTGDFIDLHHFRARVWRGAVIGAGFYELDEKGEEKPTRTPYALRHTYAAFSLAAGVNLFTLARRMGTSVKMIDETYGHLAAESEQVEQGLLAEYDRKQRKAKPNEVRVLAGH